MYDKNSVSVVLPSYKPDEKLIDTVNGLKEYGFDDIIVVDSRRFFGRGFGFRRRGGSR